MTGGPSPSRSKAMGVPSLEVTLSMDSLSSLVRRVTIVWYQRTETVLNTTSRFINMIDDSPSG
jgi:hypothetical protein